MLITYTSIVHMTQAGFPVQNLSIWLICTMLYIKLGKILRLKLSKRNLKIFDSTCLSNYFRKDKSQFFTQAHLKLVSAIFLKLKIHQV